MSLRYPLVEDSANRLTMRHDSRLQTVTMGQQECGASVTEYALILAGVAVIAIGALILFGMETRRTLGSVADQVSMDLTPTRTITTTLTVTATSTPNGTGDSATPTEGRPLEGTATPPSGGETGELPRDPDNFADNFEDGDATGWYPATGGGWVVEDGSYCNQSTPDGERRTFAGDPTWTDYSVTVRVDLSQGNGWGLYFRSTNPDQVSGYVFQYDPGYGQGEFLFRQVVNGSERSPFARQSAPAAYQWHNQWRTINVRAEGDTFTALLDGQQVLQGTHSEFRSGQVGLRLWDSSKACFDDVVITPL
jgi:Flp pilus assembly pilin Flp